MALSEKKMNVPEIDRVIRLSLFVAERRQHVGLYYLSVVIGVMS